MVGPAAKREAVAHLQSVMGLSERRACSIACADRKMMRYRSVVRRIRRCAAGFVLLPMIAAALAIGGCLCFCSERVSYPGSTSVYRLYREERLTVRNAGRAAVLWEHALPSWLPQVQRTLVA